MADEGKSELTPTLRNRYSRVRSTVKASIAKSLQSGVSPEEKSTLRKGAFFAAEEQQKKIDEKEKELEKTQGELTDEQQKRKEAEEAAGKAKKESREDELTGLLNARGIKEKLETIHAISTRQGVPFSIIYMDLDGMKYTNDHYGHPAGDELLKNTARLIELNIRRSDFAGRIGGDEYLVAMPGVPKELAEAQAEKIRRAIELNLSGQMLSYMPGNEQPLTVSLGYTTYTPPSDVKKTGKSVEELIEEADVALYESKGPLDGEKKKNRVTGFKPGMKKGIYVTNVSATEGK